MTAIYYSLCPIQVPTPSAERVYFSELQWSGLVDIVELYNSELVQRNSPILGHQAVRRYLDSGYDMWFLLPGDFVFDQALMRGYFKLADLLLTEPETLEQLAATLNNYRVPKVVIDDHCLFDLVEAYTADQFRADLKKLRSFSSRHRAFFFA